MVTVKPKEDEKPLAIRATFSFPDTEEGQSDFRAFTRHVDAGEAATIRGDYVREFEVPELLKRLGFGQPESVQLGERELLTPLTLNIEIASHVGTETLQNVPFKGRGGLKEIELTSVMDDYPWRISLTFTRSERAFQFSIRFDIEGHNVRRQLEAVRLREALAAGGTVRIEYANTGQLLAATTIETGQVCEPDPDGLNLLMQLTAIQERTGMLLSVPARPFLRHELDVIRRAYKAVQGESVERPLESIEVMLVQKGVEPTLEAVHSGSSLAITVVAEEEIDIFDTRVKLGPTIREVMGLTITDETEKAIRRGVEAGEEGPFKLTLVASEGGAKEIVRFVKWLPADEAAYLRKQFKIAD